MRAIFVALTIFGYIFVLTTSQNSTSPSPTTVGGENNGTNNSVTTQSLENIGNIFEGILTAIKNFVSFLANQVAPPVFTVLQDILSLVKQISGLVKTILGLANVQADPVFAIINGIVDIISTVLSLISNVIKGIGSAVSKRSGDINVEYDKLNTTIQGYFAQIEEEKEKINKGRHHHVRGIHKKLHHH